MGKTYIVIAAVLAIAAFFAFRGDGPAITNHPSGGTGVVAFGDSLIEGVGATQGNDLVSKLSKKAGVPIVNLGKSGDTTASALGRVDEAARRKAKVVIVLLGGNDALRKVPKEETFKNLSLIIERFQAAGSAVLLLGVRDGILTDGFEDGFEDLSERHGTAYVPDVLDGVFGKRELMSDAIHPNDAGYEMIAERIAPELRKLVK